MNQTLCSEFIREIMEFFKNICQRTHGIQARPQEKNTTSGSTTIAPAIGFIPSYLDTDFYSFVLYFLNSSTEPSGPPALWLVNYPKLQPLLQAFPLHPLPWIKHGPLRLFVLSDVEAVFSLTFLSPPAQEIRCSPCSAMALFYPPVKSPTLRLTTSNYIILTPLFRCIC